MHKERPRQQTLEIERTKLMPGVLISSLLLLVVALFSTGAAAAPGNAAKPGSAITPQSASAAGDSAGPETCAKCHDEVEKEFSSNPHAKLAEMHGKTGVTCEGCHGPGKAHVDGGDVTKISNPAKATAKEVDAKCMSCHLGVHAKFERTAHGENNVSCVSCHSVHHSEEKEQLLKAAEPKLCFRCHSDTESQFNMSFHHKVEEGLMKCSDCHDPHGTFNKNLRSSSQMDAACIKCHGETAGPFVYEHDVVKTEGCTACHFPHGGPNPHMLNRASVNTICLQCHSPSPNYTTGQPLGPAHNQASQNQPCTTCHTGIHGSNVSPVFSNSN